MNAGRSRPGPGRGAGAGRSSGQRSMRRRPPRPSKDSAASPATRRFTSSPRTSARQPWARRAPGVAPEQGDQVGAGGQQGRVDALLAGQLADPGRHERDRRPQGPVEVVVVALGQVDGVLSTLGHRLQDLLREVAPGVALVHAPAAAQLVGALGGPLGDGQHGQVGQHGADRGVRAGGPALPPRRHRLGHAPGLALQGPDVLEAQPGGLGVVGADGAQPQLLALGEGPVEAAEVLELAGQPVVEVEQVGDVARRVRSSGRP